jgi:acido-empty-quinoprotein group A
MTRTGVIWLTAALWCAASVFGGSADKPIGFSGLPQETWPTFNGDWSGRHYSGLRQINESNVTQLQIAWQLRVTGSIDGAILGAPAISSSAKSLGFPALLKSTPLMIDDVLYTTAGSQVYALDSQTGQVLWHYLWQSAAGAQLGRGVAIFEDRLYVQTGIDNYVVCLNRHSGRELWRRQVTDAFGYAGSTAPVLVGDHLVLGMGGDGNNVAPWLEARNPRSGDVQWRWYTTPRGSENGMETWPDEETAKHGGGMVWQQVTYDRRLNRIYVTTANPTPVFNGDVRRGANLFTNSIVALSADSGRMIWHFQTTPHDTHDYDGTEVPVLFEDRLKGRARQLLGQFNRNGYFFVLDRRTGKCLLTTPFIKSVNWATGVDASGSPIPNPAKEPAAGGTLVSPTSDGAVNYPAPSYSPDTGLFYANTTTSFSIMYRDQSETNPIGWGGGSEYHTGYSTSALIAMDYQNGKIRWQHEYPVFGFVNSIYPGILTTSGNLLFTGDPSGNFIAYKAGDGSILWHRKIGDIRNTPITYQSGSRQFVLVSTNDTYFAFALPEY